MGRILRIRADPLHRLMRPGINLTHRGVKLVKNGGFDFDQKWAKGVGWTIAGGVADCDGTQVANSDLSQGKVNLAAGGKYQVSYTLTRVAGTLTPVIAGATLTAQIASATIVESFTAVAGSDVIFTADLKFVGTLDDVSIIRTG